jgi:putative colanic acid biosynthesis acetyltransferase WcaF
MPEVIIITFNEAQNLPPCLQALQGWASKVYVVDSGSSDGTQDVARRHDAEVVHHDWPGYAAQRNWALANLPLEADWTLILDADEVVTPELKAEIDRITRQPPDDVLENGFFINRLSYFLNQPIRHCGYFPSWNMRLFKRGTGRYENRSVHEHVVIDNPVGYIARRAYLIHNDRRGLEHFYAKHNRYSSLEAGELYKDIVGLNHGRDVANLTRDTRHRRWLKRNVIRRLPAPGFWRFCYMYFLRLGFLDGAAGLQFCRFIAAYDAMVAFKLAAMLRQTRRSGEIVDLPDPRERTRGLSTAEGKLDHLAAARDAAPGPPPVATRHPSAEPVTTLRELDPEASPWSFRGKLARALWMVAGKPAFRLSFHNWYGYRNLILRLFGARIGKGVKVRPTVNVEIPWQLDLHDGVAVGDYAILYSLGRITMKRRSVASQYTHLCAGTHDYRDPTFPLLRLPITIEEDVWIGADAFVGPDVTIGRLSVVGARSSVYKDVEPLVVVGGNPARTIKPRDFHA